MENIQSLRTPTSGGAGKRTNQVKVMLSDDELQYLDLKCSNGNIDRATCIRDLLYKKVEINQAEVGEKSLEFLENKSQKIGISISSITAIMINYCISKEEIRGEILELIYRKKDGDIVEWLGDPGSGKNNQEKEEKKPTEKMHIVDINDMKDAKNVIDILAENNTVIVQIDESAIEGASLRSFVLGGSYALNCENHDLNNQGMILTPLTVEVVGTT